MFVAIVPLIMAIVGALMYALSANPKLQEIGRLLFLAGSIGIAIAYAGVKWGA